MNCLSVFDHFVGLALEVLKDRRWFRRLCYQYKILNRKQPTYLYNLILPFQRSSRNKGCIYMSRSAELCLLKIPF